MSNSKWYINKFTNTFRYEGEDNKLLNSDWLEVPSETSKIYYFDGTDPIGEKDVMFYTSGLTATWCKSGVGWSGYWSDNVNSINPSFDTIKEYVTTHGKLIFDDGVVKVSDKEVSDCGKSCDTDITDNDTLKPIKSDGGSSSYYFTKLPQHMIDEIVKTGGIEIKDIVRYCFDNDADCKDIIKALKRIRENLKGGGKEGVDAKYDSNKIVFFANELKKSLEKLQ